MHMINEKDNGKSFKNTATTVYQDPYWCDMD